MIVVEPCQFCGASGPGTTIRLVAEPDLGMCSRCAEQCIEVVSAHLAAGGLTPQDLSS